MALARLPDEQSDSRQVLDQLFTLPGHDTYRPVTIRIDFMSAETLTYVALGQKRCGRQLSQRKRSVRASRTLLSS